MQYLTFNDKTSIFSYVNDGYFSIKLQQLIWIYKNKTYNGWNGIGGRSAIGKVCNGLSIPLQIFRGKVCNGGKVCNITTAVQMQSHFIFKADTRLSYKFLVNIFLKSSLMKFFDRYGLL